MVSRNDPTPGGGGKDTPFAAVTTAISRAEVKTVTVGSRALTRAMVRQLDHVQPADIRPLGRVRLDTTWRGNSEVKVIGVTGSGVLATSAVSTGFTYSVPKEYRELSERYAAEWRKLPLIVLG